MPLLWRGSLQLLKLRLGAIRRHLLRFQMIQRPLDQQLHPIGHAADRQGNAAAMGVELGSKWNYALSELNQRSYNPHPHQSKGHQCCIDDEKTFQIRWEIFDINRVHIPNADICVRKYHHPGNFT